MARQFLRLSRETVFNTYSPPSSPTAADVCLISLPRDNSFTVRPKPSIGTIRSAGYDNRGVLDYAFTSDIAGKLMSYVRPSQAVFLLGMAANLTSGNCKDLGSFTADFGHMLEDGSCSPSYRRYTGCKLNAQFQVDNTAEGALMMLDADIQACGATAISGSGSISSTDFPVPADNAYPDLERPYAFFDVGGQVTVGGVRTEFSRFSFNFGNTIVPYRSASKYPSRLSWRGRSPEFSITNLYTSLQDRIDYEAIAPKTIGFTFSDGAGHSVEFDLNGRNYIQSVEDDLPLNDYFKQTTNFGVRVDTSQGTDVSVNFTNPS